MEQFLTYSLKSAGLLSIFYLAYILLLKNDTSFTVTRKFLLGGILASILLPLLYFTKQVTTEAPVSSGEFLTAVPNISSSVYTGIDWWYVTGVIYTVILGLLLLRFFLQLFRIIYLILTSPHTTSGGNKYIETTQESGPFSFFTYIVYNPDAHSRQELEMILLHEKIHARQLHSVDILLGNLLACLLWFNPLSWFYKKCIVENLEFIADKETVAASASKKEYLRTLVKVSLRNHQPALTNSFYQSFIKKRIVMLNKNTRNRRNLWKISLIFPFVLAFMLVFNVKTEASIITSEGALENGSHEFLNFQQEMVEAHFTANTTRDQLDEYKRIFKERGINLKFEQVEYSSENLLQNIKAIYKVGDKGFGGQTISPTDDENFVPFKLVAIINSEGEVTEIQSLTEDDKEISIPEGNSSKHNTVTSHYNEISVNNQETGHPIYVIDGEVVKNKTIVNALDPNKISKVEVFKGEKAIELYGNEAKDGVVIITTKTAVGKNSGNTRAGKVIIRDTVVKNRTRVIINRDSTGNRKNLVIRSTSDTSVDQPLYIIDGIEKDADFDPELLNPEDIKSMNVLKGEGAVDKYGDKAKGGVIEITTKKGVSQKASSADPQGFFVMVNASTTDEGLKIIGNQLKEEANIKVSFPTLERNKEGMITAVGIRAESKNGNVSGSYSESEGIPDVYLGGLNQSIFISTRSPVLN